jgi:isopentenyl diphosphate isomerase/L-lactate dehydrogenase-like FMN-dependent dehydrogenase
LVDVSRLDMSVELFGTRYASPIFLCPLGSQKAFQAEGEVAVARAEAAGCTAVAVTADLPIGRNTETLSRAIRSDTRQCAPAATRPVGRRGPPGRW